MSAPTLPPELHAYDLSELGFWARPDSHRMAAFARMRELDTAPFIPLRKLPLMRS